MCTIICITIYKSSYEKRSKTSVLNGILYLVSVQNLTFLFLYLYICMLMFCLLPTLRVMKYADILTFKEALRAIRIEEVSFLAIVGI